MTAYDERGVARLSPDGTGSNRIAVRFVGWSMVRKRRVPLYATLPATVAWLLGLCGFLMSAGCYKIQGDDDNGVAQGDGGDGDNDSDTVGRVVESTDTDIEGSETSVLVTVRADAVEPATNVDVSVWIDELRTDHNDLAPGTYVEVGNLAIGTTVRAEVRNTRNAGAVSIHILADNCFRSFQTCGELGCTASADYNVAKEPCINR